VSALQDLSLFSFADLSPSHIKGRASHKIISDGKSFIKIIPLKKIKKKRKKKKGKDPE
jgi:hypothetical protein